MAITHYCIKNGFGELEFLRNGIEVTFCFQIFLFYEFNLFKYSENIRTMYEACSKLVDVNLVP